MAALRAKIRIEAVTGDIVERATALLVARGITEKVCPKCNSWNIAKPCALCKRIVSSKQTLNDTIIAAAAELNNNVDVLYCYDGGAKLFAEHMDGSRCTFREPPHHAGELFAHADRKMQAR
jgi:hypothetical protein